MSPTISACPTVRSTRSLARRPPNRLVSPWTSSSVCPSIAAAKYRAGSSGASRPCTAHRARALFVPPGRRAMPDPLDPEELRAVDAWWRAANYLTVGQIYLHQNPLLREPLRPEHVKPRLLGHWGTSPGISLVYAHLTRLVHDRDADAILLVGPGHGGPAVNANVWLEGTWGEIYPQVAQDAEGMRRLFRQFSTPYGIPSHVSPPTPGSIHEGGELGYVLTHAFGAVFDNPDLLAVAIVGDGEAETGPLEGSWKGISFLNAARDGAVLPVLHLNGYKIASPTVLGRKPDEEIRALFSGHGYEPRFVEGDQPARVHQDFAAALQWAHDRILDYQAEARGGRLRDRPRWPLIVLRTPKGWTGPRELDGVRIEGTFRSHQVPLAKVREDPRQLQMLEQWMRSYRPEELFDERGRPVPQITALAPRGERRLGANPHANGGRSLQPLELPDFTRYALEVTAPGVMRAESTRQLGFLLRDVYRQNPRTFRLFCPDEANSNRLTPVFEVEDRAFAERILPGDDHLSPAGRVMEVLSEHNCEGWLEGYLLTGRHGMFVTYEAFALIVASMPPSTPSGWRCARPCRGESRWPRSTCCSPRRAGATTTTGSRTRAPVSSTRSSPRRGRSRAPTCRPTRTACSRWPTIA